MQALNGPLLGLVQKLDALGSRTLSGLAQAMKTSQLTFADIAPYVLANPQGYNRAPVVVRENYELLVMTLLPGQMSFPHDHSGSICVLRVVRGEATEGCYLIAADGFVELEYEEAVRTGEVRAFQDASVHTVRNAPSSGETLVTVHAYAPPLRDFRRFVLRPELRSTPRQAVPGIVPTVVIIGGGFSGSMTAAQLLRRAGRAGAPLRVAVVERRGAVGEGTAYATRESAHLLNVPAGEMSAWPDRPSDFLEWARRRYGNVLPTDFLPRQWYGEYIRESLQEQRAEDITSEFGARLPKVRTLLDTDIRAAYEGDPAAKSIDEVIFSYPGFAAIVRHRLAHELYLLGTPMLARIISETAHAETGIDIHPGAEIGESFFIDHGTGVDIGETSVIGTHVRLYQGVTLGAVRFKVDEHGVLIKNYPRHPIIEDDVVIYAGATILGRITIGRGSAIGGNVWLTQSVPPGSTITQAKLRNETFDEGGGI